MKEEDWPDSEGDDCIDVELTERYAVIAEVCRRTNVAEGSSELLRAFKQLISEAAERCRSHEPEREAQLRRFQHMIWKRGVLLGLHAPFELWRFQNECVIACRDAWTDAKTEVRVDETSEAWNRLRACLLSWSRWLEGNPPQSLERHPRTTIEIFIGFGFWEFVESFLHDCEWLASRNDLSITWELFADMLCISAELGWLSAHSRGAPYLVPPTIPNELGIGFVFTRLRSATSPQDAIDFACSVLQWLEDFSIAAKCYAEADANDDQTDDSRGDGVAEQVAGSEREPVEQLDEESQAARSDAQFEGDSILNRAKVSLIHPTTATVPREYLKPSSKGAPPLPIVGTKAFVGMALRMKSVSKTDQAHRDFLRKKLESGFAWGRDSENSPQEFEFYFRDPDFRERLRDWIALLTDQS